MRGSMKKSLIKDTFREVWKSRNRFLSILAIIALGTGFFAGVKATCPDMKQTAQNYYDNQHLMDLRLISTMGFNDNDLAFLQEQDGIEQLQPAYSTDALLTGDGQAEMVTKVYSFSADQNENGLNRLVLQEGRLPESSGECVIDSANMGSLQIGDTVTLSSGVEDTAITDTLSRSEYTIVGTVLSPMYINFERGNSTLSDGTVDTFLYIPESDFSLEVYTDVYLTFTDARGLSVFENAYSDFIEQKTDEYEELADIRTAKRLEEIKAEASAELDDAKQELADGEATQQEELAKARGQLDDAKQELADGEATQQEELSKARQQLDDAKEQLEASRKQAEEELAAARGELDTARQQLEQGQAEYDSQKAAFDTQIQEGQQQIDDTREQLEAQIAANPDLAAILQEQLDALDEQQALLDQQKQQGEAELAAALEKLEQGAAELAAGEEQYKTSQAEAEKQLADAQQKIDDGEAEYESQKASSDQELADARRQIEEGEAEYESQKASSDQELADARQEIADAEEEIAQIEQPQWYITDRSANPGYGDFGTDADRVDAIAKVFPVFFILVAALVCLTTMTRMVEEQRTQIGTLKALGYGKGAIIGKFLVYAISASILGSIIGLTIGFKLFPIIIFNAYSIMYVIPGFIAPFKWDYAAWCTLAAVLCTALSALASCYTELIASPAQLMRPKAPKAGKRILLERITPIWSHLNFSYKVTMRNIFRYKKRILMTVVGIAGCTALMLTGFGLRHAITSIADLQYNNIFVYDMLGMADDSDGNTPMPQVEQTLADNSHITQYMTAYQETVDAKKDSVTKSVYLFVPQSPEEMTGFIILRTPGSGQAISLPDDGAVINQKLADMLDAKEGDTIQVQEASGNSVDIKISAITENYTFNYVYISPAYYQTLYNEAPVYNLFLANNDLDSQASAEETTSYQAQLSEQLLKDDNILGISYSSDVKGTFDDLLGSLNYIVLVIIVSAGGLAFIVLYNLTNINVNERIRELATIKVLGFYDREVSAYIYRENIISTLIGIAIGLIGGIFLNQFVISTSEVDAVMFARDINALSFILAALLTLCFTLIVNIALHFKLKKIDMTSSLKSVE